MKITYAGRTEIISDNLLEKRKIIINKPKLSHKFDVPSLYYDGYYYFIKDGYTRCEEDGWEGKYKVTIVFYNGKWRQDYQYINKDLLDVLLHYYKKLTESEE